MNPFTEKFVTVALAVPLTLAAVVFIIMATWEGECRWTHSTPRGAP